ncbi:MAG TPA: dynamin family protein [Ktedonobacterales bacterium]|nr:dynamin family protein [Ktedonobacterales bacterium]
MSSGGFSAAQQKVKALLFVLRDAATLIGEPGQKAIALKTGAQALPGLGLTSDAASLEIRASDIEQGIFKVLVLGEFKNGKSTLLNAMLGHKTLPARAAPATAIITELVYGKREDVAIYEAGKATPRRLSWEAFVQEFQLSERDIQTLKQQQYLDRFQDVEYAQIECQHPFCANGVRLIDSPGLGEHISRTRVSTNFLKQAQAVIVVLNAISILTEAERAYIERLGEGRLNQVFFVINRINQIEQDEVESIKSWVQQTLKPHFVNEEGDFDEVFYARRVFFVNAKGALDARLTIPNNEALLESSGLPILEDELEHFLTTDEKLTASLDGTLQTLAYVVANARRRIAQQQRSLGEPLEDLARRREETEQRLAALDLTRQDIERTILFFGESVKQKIYLSLLNFIERMHDTWPEDSIKLMNLAEAMGAMDLLKSFLSQEAKEKVVAAVKKEIRSYLQVKLTQWSETIPALVQPDLKKLTTELEALAVEFQRELDAIGNVFASGNDTRSHRPDKKGAGLLQLLLGVADLSQMTGSMLSQPDWEGFFGQSLQQAITVSTIFSFFGGVASWGWLLLLIDEFLSLVTQGPVFSTWVLKPLGEKLHENLLKEAPTKQDDIYRRVDHIFADLAGQVTKALQDYIEEARREQQSIIQAKEQEGFSAEQERQRLERLLAELLELLNSASEIVHDKRLTAEELERLLAGEPLLPVDSVA